MASPTVVTTAESATTTIGTNHVITLPSGITAGDLILICMDIGSTLATLNAHADYAELLDENLANGLKILYRKAVGGESNPTLVTSATTRSATIAFRISGADGLAPRVEIGTTGTGTSATPDPPASATPNASDDYLFVAIAGMAGEEADDDTWGNTPPTNYLPSPPLQKACGTAVSSLGGLLLAAYRQLTTGSAENPSTFGVDVSAAWRSQTITVYPTVSAGANSYRQLLTSLSPTHYWPFDETAGTNADEPVGGLDGTYVNTPALNQTGLIAEGTAVSFTRASSQYVTVPDHADLKGFSSVSVVVPVTFATLPGAGNAFILMGKSSSAFDTAGEWSLSVSDSVSPSQTVFTYWNGASTTTVRSSAWSPATTKRYLLGFVWTGSVARFYVNGIQVGPDVAATGTIGSTDTTVLLIGATNAAAPGSFWNGKIDEPAIWKNVVLTGANMLDLYAALDVTPSGTAWDPGTQTEAIGITDTADLVLGRTVAQNDALAMVDVPLSVAVFNRELATETLALTDSPTPSAGVFSVLADTAGITDLAAQEFGKTQALEDTATIADASIFDRGLAQADAATIADLQAFDRGLVQTDATGIADSVAAGLAFSRTQDDPLDLSDTGFGAIELRHGWVLIKGEEVAITDLAATLGAFSRDIADPLGIADTPATVAALIRTVADPVAITDLAATVVALLRVQDDAAAITDSQAFLAALLRTIDDPAGITDNAVPDHVPGGAGLTQPLADTLGIADTLATVAAFVRTQDDPLGLADLVAFAGAFVRTQADTLGITDLAFPDTSKLVAVTDALGIADSQAFLLAYQQLFAEALALTDLAAMVAAYQRQVADALGITDQTLREILGAGPTTESHPPLGGVILVVTTGGVYDEVLTGGVPFGR